MDRRTLIFIFLATAIFVLWSVMQRPKTLPVEPGSEDAGVVSESGEFAETTAPDGATPSVTSTGAVSGRIEAEANAVRQSAATRVVSAAYDVEVAHATASLRAWRLENYPDRDPAGQLENHPVDLIPTYSPDYGGLLLGAERLMWEPLETYSDRIQLATPTDSTTLAFRAYHGDLEIVKTFTFHGTTQQLVDHGGDEAWRGYAVDIDVTFRNLGEATTDLAAQGYELRWGPGITADREPYMPKEYGAMGGLLSTGQLPTLTPIRDDDLDAPGPQTKDGEDADAIENKRTVWSAIQSKFFIATFLSGELTSPQAALPRSARFSEYNPFPLKWPSEPERYRIVLNVGKEWLTDSEHLNQSKTKRFLLIPSGTTRLNAEITQAVQGAKDTDKARRKTRETLQRAYADYGNVAELLSGMRLEVDGFFLQPGQSQTDTYRLYAGPKHTAILSHVVLPDNVTPAKITETISFGITGPLAKGLLWLLNAFHKLIPNYGVAIILLTILVRLALFPLSQSSSKSMKKMQNRMKIIQPELDDARKKFGDDPQKMNAETMKVYRKYGINPASQLGGCLMILAQMPIFIAMYSMLRNSAELRGEPFTLWINDLTAPDLLYSVGGLPIRLLPLIVMGGTLIQQRMNPTAGTMQGSQKMMMNLMPIMFVFIFYGMASGLNLYWGISTFIGVGQQYLVNKFSEDTEENLTAADLERMAKQDRKKKRQRAPARP